MSASQRHGSYFFAEKWWDTDSVVDALVIYFKIQKADGWESALLSKCYCHYYGCNNPLPPCVKEDVREFCDKNFLPFTVRRTAWELSESFLIDPVKLRASRPQAAE